jgi:uncharacterized protein YcbK (DUF882 family)
LVPPPSFLAVKPSARRNFLKYALAAVCLPTEQAIAARPEQGVFEAPRDEETPSPLVAQPPISSPREEFWSQPRSLNLVRKETRERLNVVYWKEGKLIPEAYWRVCALLRDTRQGLMTGMDPRVLDILRGVQGYYDQVKWSYPLVVTSGFRTKKTNDSLVLEGAAKNSMHLYGRAVDLYIPGVPPADLARLGLYFRGGGVGFYPKKGFVHLDTGNFRFWSR